MSANLQPDGDTLRDEALERVARNREEWLTQARVAVLFCNESKPDGWTSDDVWKRLGAWGVFEAPEPRIMGAALSAAHRAGLIEPTGNWRKCTRRSRHSSPVREWRAAR